MRTLIILAGVVVLGCGPFAADDPTVTVEQVLAKHADARGGAEAWAEVKTLEIEGTWTAFSEDGPMTIRRMRPDLYRFDHVAFAVPSVLAFDGDAVWMHSPIYEAPEPKVLEEPWQRNIREDSAFGSLLLAHAAAGVAVELTGRDRVEGQDVWVLRVSPKDAPPETWYLDATTFLETRRDSRTFDVFSGGIETDMETYYMDFRAVEGVVMPFREERHFGTRYHVYEATTIRVNVEMDEARFRGPEITPPAEP